MDTATVDGVTSHLVEVSGVKLIASGDRICASVLRGKPFEPASLAEWGKVCAPGRTVLDIGAYTGLYSIKAALCGAKPMAFEPMSFNRKRMAENAVVNGVSFPVSSAAVSSYCGEGKLIWNPKVQFTSGASLVRRKGERMDVLVVTVDSLELSDVAAMKIDVERGEPEVLAGARETIKRHRPVILLEVLDGQRERGVKEALKDLRYRRQGGMMDERNWLMVPC